MSRTADIDFSFAEPLSVSRVVQALAPARWGLAEPNGVSYAVEDDLGDLDWELFSREQPGDVLRVLDSPERVQQQVGLSIYHVDARTGGTLLFFPGRVDMSFVPEIDRRSHAIGREFTDVPWYLEMLLPGLVSVGLTGYVAEDVAD